MVELSRQIQHTSLVLSLVLEDELAGRGGEAGRGDGGWWGARWLDCGWW